MSQDIEDTYGAPPKAVNRVAGRCRDVEGQAGHHRNRYQVDPALAGCKVELVFDPFDLSFLRARHEGRDAGTAQPFQVSRLEHAHRVPEPGITTGCTSIRLLLDQRHGQGRR